MDSKQKSRLWGKTPFFLLLFLVLVMTIATFVEKWNGTPYAYTYFYGSWWFILLWAILALVGIVRILQNKMYKKLPLIALHLSFILILAGAFITHKSSEEGFVHLRKKTYTNFFQQESGATHTFPFNLKLISFHIEYYPGTESPADYVSVVEVSDKDTPAPIQYTVSMNNIAQHKGYRFYQSSFDDDLEGTILSVNRDIYGIPVTYSGYFLLFFSMLLNLINPKGKFRSLLRNPMLKKSSAILILGLLFSFPCFAGNNATASTVSKDSVTISKTQAKEFGKIWMVYEGRITPLQTFAIDFTKKLTGKGSYKYASSEQVLAGWLFFPEKWQHVPMFKIENQELRKVLDVGENACLNDFFDDHRNYKLSAYQKEIYQGGKHSAFIKAAAVLDEKVQLINMLQSGGMLKVFPYENKERIIWYTPTETLPDFITSENVLFIKNFFSLYYSAIRQGQSEEALLLLQKLGNYQQLNASAIIPASSVRKLEMLYNNSNIFSLLFKINLTIGILAFVGFIVQMLSGRTFKKLNFSFIILLLLSFVVHSLAFGFRSYLGGHSPVSNGYEAMLLIAWCAMLIALCLRRYSFSIPAFGLLISGFALLVAHLGMMNPKITPLVPVLSSPLLSVHVSLIMFSYALTAFLCMNTLAFICLLIFGKKDNKNNILFMLNKLTLLNHVMLYPCTFFMGAGIFVGAIWANVSWGRYWGWDPKEVWALITFLLMVLPLHGKTIKKFNNIFVFNIYSFVIFAAVLMTYFGVNYFLGGLHSYAGSAKLNTNVVLIAIIVIILTISCIFAYRKYKTFIKN